MGLNMRDATGFPKIASNKNMCIWLGLLECKWEENWTGREDRKCVHALLQMTDKQGGVNDIGTVTEEFTR